MFPPKHPNLSTRVTLTPVLAAAKAAANPPGPEPTTKTSVSWTTSIYLEGSSINFFIIKSIYNLHSIDLPND